MVVNDVEYIFFGMRRGGQHAIIHWLASHFDEPVWFVNDIGTFNTPYIHEDDTNVYEPREFRNPCGVENFWKLRKKVLFQSYEDKAIDDLDLKANESVVGRSARRVFIIVIRDPLNLFASRMRNAGFVFRIESAHVKVWKQHARESLGYTSYLPDVVTISFNDWVSSAKYRRRIETILGLGSNDTSRNRVFGVGSSFDQRKYDGKADQMDVLNRWRAASTIPFFRELISDHEIWSLSESIFGVHGERVIRPIRTRRKAEPLSLVGKRLVYIRIPKTASTTLKVLLKKYASERGLRMINKPHGGIYEPIEGGPFDLSLHHVVFSESNVKRLTETMPGCLFISSVRDPILRARSHYHHVGPAGQVNRFAIAGMPFNEWYMKYKDVEGVAAGWKEPVTLRHWTNGTMATFMGFSHIRDITYDVFADRFSFVLVAEKIDLSLKILFSMIGWKTDIIENMRVSTNYDKCEIASNVVSAFRERNKLDYAIYDMALRLLGDQSGELGIEQA